MIGFADYELMLNETGQLPKLTGDNLKVTIDPPIESGAYNYEVEARKSGINRLGTKIGEAFANKREAVEKMGPRNTKGFTLIQTEDQNVLVADISTESGAQIAAKALETRNALNGDYGKVAATTVKGPEGNDLVAVDKGDARRNMTLGGARPIEQIIGHLPTYLTTEQRDAMIYAIKQCSADGAFIRVPFEE